MQDKPEGMGVLRREGARGKGKRAARVHNQIQRGL